MTPILVAKELLGDKRLPVTHDAVARPSLAPGCGVAGLERVLDHLRHCVALALLVLQMAELGLQQATDLKHV